MFTVSFWVRGGQRYPTRTSNPNQLVENVTKAWESKGYWVQVPLLPDTYPAVYEGFLKGKKMVSMTIRRDEDEHERSILQR